MALPLQSVKKGLGYSHVLDQMVTNHLINLQPKIHEMTADLCIILQVLFVFYWSKPSTSMENKSTESSMSDESAMDELNGHNGWTEYLQCYMLNKTNQDG
jgi:hypothetical protein